MASITVIGASSTCKLPSIELYKKYKLTSISIVKLHSFDGNKSRHVTNNLLLRHNRLANFNSSNRFLPSAVTTPNSSSSSLLSDEAFQGLGSDFDGKKDDDFPSWTASLNADKLDISKLDLPSQLVNSLRERGITQLFPIQRAVLVPALQGRDTIALAKTGTAKTLAFGNPIINGLDDGEDSDRYSNRRLPRALVLAPTRELAKQVEKEIKEYAPYLKTACALKLLFAQCRKIF